MIYVLFKTYTTLYFTETHKESCECSDVENVRVKVVTTQIRITDKLACQGNL